MNLPNRSKRVIRPLMDRLSTWLFSALVILLAGFYFSNISGWLIHDDEGTDIYEAWQLQMGKQPGADFAAEQQPLFLLLGKTGLSLTENSLQAIVFLRILSAVQVLAGAIFLAMIVRRKWGPQTATLTLGLVLTSGLVYEQARLFRPDPMMFGWELFGFGFVLLATQTKRRQYWATAGIAYGVAVLMKLFGLFPVIGLGFFFVYLFINNTNQWRQHFLNGLAFSLPFLLVSVGVSLLLYSRYGFYYQDVLNQHLSLGREKTILDQLLATGGNYLLFILFNSFAIFIVPLVFMNRRSGELTIQHQEKALLALQLVVPIVFLFFTRPLYPRYFMFLLPPLALLMACQFMDFVNKVDQRRPNSAAFTSVLILLPIGFSLFAAFPRTITLLTRTEEDTIALAEYIRAHTQPNDVVISDYASLNFHAQRPSIFEASIIAGAQIRGGIIMGALLIQRIEESQARMVLIHVADGEPTPHQLVKLVDYAEFRKYLETNFHLATVFDRAGQKIEVFERR